MQRHGSRAHCGRQQTITGATHHRSRYTSAARIGLHRAGSTLQQAGMGAAGLPAHHHHARVEHHIQILDQHAQVTRCAQHTFGTAQCPGTDKGLRAPEPPAGAQLAIYLHDAVADLAGHAAGAGKQPVVQHNTSTHPNIATHKDQRVDAGTVGKLVFAQRCRVTIVVQMQTHIRQACLDQSFGQQVQKLDVAPTQIGRKLHQAAGVFDGSRQAHPHPRELQLVACQSQPGAPCHGGCLRADRLRLIADQGLLRADQHLARQRHTNQAHLLYPDLDAHQHPNAAMDVQRRGRPTDSVPGYRRARLAQPVFVEQFAHQRAHGGLGQAALQRQARARQPGLRAQQAQQHAAIDALDELLVTRGVHAVSAPGVRSGFFRWAVCPG